MEKFFDKVLQVLMWVVFGMTLIIEAICIDCLDWDDILVSLILLAPAVLLLVRAQKMFNQKKYE